jgi:hypothetical protein
VTKTAIHKSHAATENEMSDLPLSELHDATLESIRVDWESGAVVLAVKTREGHQTLGSKKCLG